MAVIPTAFDLGAVTEFWLKPAAYARFLGVELSLVYKGPLLVAMPNGFGLNWPGHATSSANRLLAKIRPGSSGERLLDAVQSAIRELAASAGAKAAPTASAAAGGGNTLEVSCSSRCVVGWRIRSSALENSDDTCRRRTLATA